jgi:hypothetical protein
MFSIYNNQVLSAKLVLRASYNGPTKLIKFNTTLTVKENITPKLAINNYIYINFIKVYFYFFLFIELWIETFNSYMYHNRYNYKQN